jgi:hypothetical protein
VAEHVEVLVAGGRDDLQSRAVGEATGLVDEFAVDDPRDGVPSEAGTDLVCGVFDRRPLL